MKTIDQTLTHWTNIAAGHHAIPDSIMIAASQFGVPLLVLVVALQWWSPDARFHVRHTCVAAGLSFLVGLGLNQLILLFVHRVRPYDVGISHLIINPSSDWSFPSDHATATIAIATAFLLHGLNRRAFALFAGAALVCVSRIYVGTHYVSDVLGGALTGVLAAAAVRLIYRENTRADHFITRIL